MPQNPRWASLITWHWTSTFWAAILAQRNSPLFLCGFSLVALCLQCSLDPGLTVVCNPQSNRTRAQIGVKGYEIKMSIKCLYRLMSAQQKRAISMGIANSF